MKAALMPQPPVPVPVPLPRRALRLMGWFCFVACAAVLVAGFCGALHPAFDSIALLRIPAAAGSLSLALLLARPRALVWTGAGLSAGVLALLGAERIMAGPDGQGIAIYQKNLWAGNVASRALIADIRDSGADLVMLQEVSDRNFPLLALLEDDYPHQQFCRFSAWSGMAVLSRFPAVEEGICSDGRGMAGLQVEGPDGPFWALSIHLHWPWPHGQAGQVDGMLPQLRALDGPVVIGGDFNMVAWGRSVRRIAAATGTQRAGPRLPTIFPYRVPLPIDMVFAPDPGRAERRPQFGSDHSGIVARVPTP